jgi:phosphoribosylanthranilate isomerase
MTLLNRAHGFSETASPAGLVVKTCGIMHADHARAAAQCGASMIGLVFARSRRTISVEVACSIRSALDGVAQRPLLVGVFVNEATRTILDIAESVRLDIIQFSGDETPVEVAECTRHYPVLKALRFRDGTSVEEAIGEVGRFRALASPDRLRFIVDTYRDGEYGGTGRVADWGIASRLAEHDEIMLAGGLTPRNIELAVKEVAPWGVDVSSGVERDGAKDRLLIETFITNARRVSGRGRSEK